MTKVNLKQGNAIALCLAVILLTATACDGLFPEEEEPVTLTGNIVISGEIVLKEVISLSGYYSSGAWQQKTHTYELRAPLNMVLSSEYMGFAGAGLMSVPIARGGNFSNVTNEDFGAVYSPLIRNDLMDIELKNTVSEKGHRYAYDGLMDCDVIIIDDNTYAQANRSGKIAGISATVSAFKHSGEYHYQIDLEYSGDELGKVTGSTTYISTCLTTTSSTADVSFDMQLPDNAGNGVAYLAIEQVPLDIPADRMKLFLEDPEKNPLKVPLTFTKKTTTGEDILTQTITGELVLNGKLPEIECRMDPISLINGEPDYSTYDKWEPKASMDKQLDYAGNIMFVKAMLHEKGKPTVKSSKQCKFQFRLKDVSREKGICNNYPLDGSADYDLRIANDRTGLKVDADGQYAETVSNVSEMEIAIESMDYGAYGALEITAVLENGQSIPAYVNAIKGDDHLEIPKDDNRNHIADAWEDKYPTVKGRDSKWDEDPQPAGQRRNGDGYTLYEEYRGFKVLNGTEPVRTDPTKKDLFVYDRDGLAKKYFGAEESADNPAQLTLHYIDPQFFPYKGGKNSKERCVNFNSVAHRYADQFALVIVEKDYGETKSILGAAKDFDNPNTSMKDVYLIEIYTGAHREILSGQASDGSYVFNLTGADLERFYNDMVKGTVIHETGHAIGVEHHGGGDGEVIEPKEDWQIPINTARMWHYGVLDCAMRYTRQKENSRITYIFDRFRYCRESETWSVMIDGGLRTFPSHNCWSQIDVKSDP
jgi:hypothetical protein